jgi:cysteine-rich repeat protein
VLDPGEECDDGNNDDDDGCSSDCKIEEFEREYECGEGCLNTTIITVSVPFLHPDRITYSFKNTSNETCDVSYFVLFDIPNCTEVVNVTADPPSCLLEYNIPCANAGEQGCDQVGPCADDFSDLIGRPIKVDIASNNCSITIHFGHNMTFTEAQFGIKGAQECSNCTVLVPEDCYEPPQIFPEFVCWWDWANGTCVATYNYSLVDADIAIVPKGPRNFLNPMALPGTDNTPVIFTTPGQMIGRTTQWDCWTTPWQLWTVDGQSANASTDPQHICPDCNQNGIPDPLEIEIGLAADCNENCVPDECDIEEGTSLDVNDNQIPDECEMPGMEPPPPPGGNGNGPSPWPGIIGGSIFLAVCCCVSCFALFADWEECREEETEEECERRRNRGIWVIEGNAAQQQQQRAQPAGSATYLGGLFNDSGHETDHSERGHRKPD